MENRPKKLLFVDDEPFVLETLSRMLYQSGENWTGEFCGGVDEALAALNQSDFDTIILDMRMPLKDGVYLLKAMREDSRLRRIPVIVLTGQEDRNLKREVLNLGASDLLNKPVDREDLVARIRSSLRLKEYQDQLENQVDTLDRLVRERTRQLELSHREVISRLAKAGEFRDDQTGSHVARVALCSGILAEGMGMPPDIVDLIVQAAPMHDIGKIGIPDYILLKPGRLTTEERNIMEEHTIIGENILRNPPRLAMVVKQVRGLDAVVDPEPLQVPLLDMAARIARSHHEKWDGWGYPDHLAGERIPVEACVVAVADVYDALVSVRPYKEAMPLEEARMALNAEAGRHFHPQVIQVFMSNLEKIDDIYKHFEGNSETTPIRRKIDEAHFIRR